MRWDGGLEKPGGRNLVSERMNILLIHTENFRPGDLLEMTRDIKANLYVADSREEALNMIAVNPIEVVIFALRTFNDLELLKYLNTSYPQIDVLLTARDDTSKIINILKEGRYQVLPPSFRLPELQRSLESVIGPQTACIGNMPGQGGP